MEQSVVYTASVQPIDAHVGLQRYVLGEEGGDR